jgi:hypothetical protein
MKHIPFLLLMTVATCTSPAKLGASAGYGLSPESPIKVGGLSERSGPASERAYLDRLRGPNGEAVIYERVESCCEFETLEGILGRGMLDVYEVRYEGLRRPVRLYLNMYDPAEVDLRAASGFKLSS